LKHIRRDANGVDRPSVDWSTQFGQTRSIERAAADEAQSPEPEPAQPTQAVPRADAGFGRALSREPVGSAGLAGLSPSNLLALQRSVGNRELSRLIAHGQASSTEEVTGPAPARPAAPRRGPRVYLARMRALAPAAGRSLLRISRGPWSLQRTYSRSSAAAYAKKWAMSDNPAYGRIEPNDCTNFVSQALLEGGWTMVGGSVWDRKKDTVWWFGKSVWTKGSYSWGGAQNLYNFMKKSGRGTVAAAPMDLEIGDILQMDMGPGHYHAGTIGHSMVVTDKRDNDLFLSYHEPHKLDEPFSSISSRYPTATWYPWKPS